MSSHSCTRSARLHFLATFFVACVLTIPSAAQDAPSFHHGWFVSPATQVTSIKGEAAVLTGMRAGWVGNHRWRIGAEAYTLDSNVRADKLSPEGKRNVAFFYSGVSAEYVVPVSARLNVAPRALVGGAEAHWRKGFWDNVAGDMERDDRHTTSLVLEPGLTADVTINNWISLTAGASYRYVTAGKSQVLDQADMSGFSGGLGLRFGRF